MTFYTEQFFSESEQVQMAVLRAFVIFFLNEVEESDEILMDMFEKINTKHHNPFVRD